MPSTPVKTLERAHAIARAEGLNYVYIGNVPGHPTEHTVCPGCNQILVNRSGYYIRDVQIQNGHCKKCNQQIPGVWGV
ncbi:MAG: hypothetical protein E4H13_04720 [Calditrichales bacterium]|nr:MAG: hypothetical protein E4H13_04720 [Calditrichales bacterium]